MEAGDTGVHHTHSEKNLVSKVSNWMQMETTNNKSIS